MLLQIMKPNSSEEGSNTPEKEKEVYQLFVKYVEKWQLLGGVWADYP